jgi:predicted regulator of Ras-like GTPase activity (Roadblock/LC7/MglB family)
MFRDLLKRIVEECEGGLAGLLMGFDGIAVDSYVSERAQSDIQSVGMEFSVILTQARNAVSLLGGGALREVAFKSEKMTVIIRLLNDEYFLALALEPEGNYGKGRYLLRSTAPTILSELG